MSPISLLIGLLFLAVLALAAATAWQLAKLRRARDAHGEQIERGKDELQALIHEHALAADLRADALGVRLAALEERLPIIDLRLDALELHQHVDHLHDLVALGELGGRLEPTVARRLRQQALDLRDDCTRETHELRSAHEAARAASGSAEAS